MVRIPMVAAVLFLPLVAVHAADEKAAKPEAKAGEKLLIPEAFRGRWELEFDRLAEMPFAKEMPEQKRALVLEQLRKTLAEMSWDFGADTLTMRKGDMTFPPLPVELNSVAANECRGRVKRVDERWEDVRIVKDDKGLVLYMGRFQAPVKRAGK